MQSGRGTRTVLFTDMVSSTALRTELGDDRADLVRDEHERVLRAAVENNGGTVVKVMGDGLMAVFDGAAAGLAASVALQRAAYRQADRTWLPIKIRVGLSAGDVTWDDDDYHGTPVVEAARLEPKASPGTILASESVRILAGSRTDVAFNMVGPLELKGLPGPFTAYEVAWNPGLDQERPLPPMLVTSGEAPFVGRDEELGQLRDLWASTETSGPQLVFVTGEAGIGKTRLAAELARAAQHEGATVLAGRCDDELDVPYQPFVEALRFFVEQSASDYLAEDLGMGRGELVRLIPELIHRLPDLSPAPVNDPETARYRLFEAITGWLVAASISGPLLLVVDDLQWASKATFLLIRHLARSSTDMRVLIMVTWRDTGDPVGGPLDALLGDTTTTGRVTKIPLGGLEREEVDHYVEETLARTRSDSALPGAPQQLGQLVHNKSEGNPLFMQELMGDLLDLGVAEHDIDPDMLALLGVPETVRDIVLRRIARLEEPTQRILSVAAVIGMQFEAQVLEGSLDLHGDEVVDALDQARSARFVRERQHPIGSFEFEHGLVRDVLYAELGVTRRARLHVRIATELDAMHGDELDGWAAEIAAHLMAGGRRQDEDRAAELLIHAGEVAIRSLSYEQAVTTFESALTLFESSETRRLKTRLRLLLALGDAKFRTLDFDGSKKAFNQVLDLASRGGDSEELARAAYGLARAAQPGEPDPVLGTLLDQAIDALPADDSYLRAQLLAVRAALALQNTGEGQRPELAEQAVSMAERLGDPAELAVVVGASVIATFTPDLLEQRLGYIDLQIKSSDRSGHLEAACEAYGWRATSMIEAGRIDSVRSDVERMQHIADDLGQPWYRAMAQQRRAMIAQLSSDYETAETLATESLSAAPQQQMAVLAGYAGLTWAVRRDQGRLSEVEPALVSFASMAPDVAAWQATIAQTALELGRIDDARNSLGVLASKGLGSIPRDWLWLATIVLAAEVAAEVADDDIVRELADLLRPFERRGAPVAVGIAYLGSTSRALGLLDLRMGNHDVARRELKEAIAMEEGFGSPAYSARAKLALARAYMSDDANDPRFASELLQDAHVIATRLSLLTLAQQIADLGGPSGT